MKSGPPALALALAVAACAAAPDAVTSRWGERVLFHPPRRVSPRDPGWHEAYAPLAGDRTGPEALAVARDRLASGVRLARAALSSARVEPGARRFLDSIGWDSGGFDLATLHARSPETGPGGAARVVRLAARAVPGGFAVDLAPGRTEPPAGAGSVLLVARVTPSSFEGRPTHRLELSMAIDTGATTGPAAAAVLERIRRRFDRPAGAAGPQARFADGEEEARLGPEDRVALGEIQSAFPRTIERILNVVVLEDLVEPAGGLRVAVRRSPRLGRRFGHLDAYLDRLDDLASIRLAVGEDRLALETRDARLEGEVRPDAGGLAPRRRGLASIDVRAAGLVVHVHDLPFDVLWRAGPDETRLEVVLDRMPRSMGVRGELLGLVDPALVEGLAGLDLDRMLRDFLATMLRGGGGRGTRLVLEWRRDGARNLLEARLETEIAANRAAGTGRRIATTLYTPEEDVRSDLRAIADAVLEGLLLDLEAFGERRFDRS